MAATTIVTARSAGESSAKGLSRLTISAFKQVNHERRIKFKNYGTEV
jgi:hypothetical protein